MVKHRCIKTSSGITRVPHLTPGQGHHSQQLSQLLMPCVGMRGPITDRAVTAAQLSMAAPQPSSTLTLSLFAIATRTKCLVESWHLPSRLINHCKKCFRVSSNGGSDDTSVFVWYGWATTVADGRLTQLAGTSDVCLHVILMGGVWWSTRFEP